jgi:hypothetical protein
MCMPQLRYRQASEFKSGGGESNVIPSSLAVVIKSYRLLSEVTTWTALCSLCDWSAVIPSEDVPDHLASPGSIGSARI